MTAKGIVLGLVGSPNREGRTNQLVRAALEGAARAGVRTELVQMADHVVVACKDCLPNVCPTNEKCTYEDDAFEYLSEKVLSCGALILGTPVYWWDASMVVKRFIQKMYRVYAPSAPLHGLPVLGIDIAGGAGRGLISGLRSVYHFFLIMQMRALEPLPATRFNFDIALQRAGELGSKLASMANERAPFKSMEERLLWYDALPYLSLSLAGEMRLLADITAQELGSDEDSAVCCGLARADALAAGGMPAESLAEIVRVYEACAKAFERK